jgi:hypothetical protein
MLMNNTTEMPMRKASALAMGEALGTSSFSGLLRTMKNKAVARLAKTPKKANAMKKVMKAIIC